MRTLKFIVEGQAIKQDPNCDFSGLIPGTVENKNIWCWRFCYVKH